MEKQKMSSQERIYQNILSLYEQIQSLDKEIENLKADLAKEGLTAEDKKALEEDIVSLSMDRDDLSADAAMLEELLAKMGMEVEEPTPYEEYDGGGGLDWNESGYFD